MLVVFIPVSVVAPFPLGASRTDTAVLSGCAVGGLMWLTYKVVDLLVNLSHNRKSVVVTGLVTNIAITIAVVTAVPWIRNHRHKYALNVDHSEAMLESDASSFYPCQLVRTTSSICGMVRHSLDLRTLHAIAQL
jgi:hypothetical protein